MWTLRGGIILLAENRCTTPFRSGENTFVIFLLVIYRRPRGLYVHYLYTLCVQLFNDVQLTELNCQHFETLISPRF